MMTPGHHKYLDMPYGLINTSSFFQPFLNEVLREFPNQLIVNIDGTPIFSNSEEEHVLTSDDKIAGQLLLRQNRKMLVW